SRINSHFYVDYSSVVTPERVESMGLGEIKPGYEWFAFVFSGQPLDDGLVRDKFLPSIRFSENKLMNAYSRMSLDQGWMQGTANEMDVFLDVYGKADGTILDLGCGRGRHSIELSQRGYNVHGIDFADNNIQIAGELSSNIDNQPNFDVVNVVSKDNISVLQDKYDAVLALYDVVGSYPDEESNREIILEAFNHLIDGGLLFLSVMNMELTSRLIRPDHQGNVAKDPSLLFRLEPIRIMQNTGDVFDPRYMVLDSESGLVYRKEQFVEDGDLSAEYVIRDKRYREKEIVSMLEEVGFHVDEVRRVRAGHFDEALSQDDLKAKELLVIARKR
ncbi:MAG: class I SAM-dependent methyltransferase, partial [Eubacterium sp.]|nr:class I SAM-dependent methyltransferase [Eubacterium sp.]